MRQWRSGLVLLAWAVAAKAAPTGADKLAAEALFDAARKLMEEGKFASACPKFEESNRLDPAVGVLLYLADCHEKSGKLASAWLSWREAAAAAHRAGQAEREKLALQRAGQLEPKLARVQLEIGAESAVEGLVVLRDGSEVKKALWGVPVPIDPGEHIVEARAPGRKPWTRTLNIIEQPSLLVVQIPALEAEAPVPAASASAAPVASAAPAASSAPPPVPAPTAPPPSREQGPSPTAAPRAQALLLGVRLGGVLPMGQTGATASGRSSALSSLYGPGGAVELNVGVRLHRNLAGVAWAGHAALSGGSALGAGGAESKGASRQVFGVGVQLSTGDSGKLGAFGEVGLLIHQRYQLQERSAGDQDACTSTTSLAGSGGRIGGGLRVPLADKIQLAPYVSVDLGRFVQASYEGTGRCGLRSGAYDLRKPEVHASLMAGAALSYGFEL
jgi:serine/threonine-protein kinase